MKPPRNGAHRTNDYMDAGKSPIIRHFLSIVGDRSIIPLNPAGFRQLVEDLVMSERGLPAPPGP